MSEPFLGELRMFSYNRSIQGWARCDGQFLPINQNQALFSLLGTMYGGDGRTTFALPDLRGRTPIHVGDGFSQGTRFGEESHTLTQSEMPTHLHGLIASSQTGDQAIAQNNLFGSALNQYRAPEALTTLTPATITNVGGSQAHENRMPYLTIVWMIALQGIFPSRN
jgi:microcystin-dependent protein